MDTEKIYLMIVALVAVVAIVMMTNPQTFSSQVSFGDESLMGQATATVPTAEKVSKDFFDETVPTVDPALQTDYDAGKFSRVSMIKGDVNGDLTINYRDAELLAGYTQGLESFSDNEFYAADLNDDNTLDEVDKKALLLIVG